MAVQTILVTTDGSDRSNAAARRGFDLAAALEASVHVLSVADSSIAAGAGYSGNSPSIRERLREKATERATALSDEATARGIPATAVTREGIPANEIVRYADEQGTDAIIIGTAGRGSITRTVVGSVADKVVRTASTPVITITPTAANAETTTSVNTILLPTDGSETATVATDLGVELAVRLNAAVHFLSVIDHARASALSKILDPEDTEELRERSSSYLETLASHARDRGLKAHTAIQDGDPAEEIVRYAESEGVDLIALGTAGRGGFERVLVGSVADKVLRTAPIPVLTTRSGKLPDGTES